MSTITVGASTLTEVNDTDNARTWATSNHTVSKPQMVIQRRKPAPSASTGSMARSYLKVSFGTVDADSIPIAQKITFDLSVNVPIGALPADVSAAEALFQEFVADADFSKLASTQFYYD